jgi:hypothetical protein
MHIRLRRGSHEVSTLIGPTRRIESSFVLTLMMSPGDVKVMERRELGAGVSKRVIGVCAIFSIVVQSKGGNGGG